MQGSPGGGERAFTRTGIEKKFDGGGVAEQRRIVQRRATAAICEINVNRARASIATDTSGTGHGARTGNADAARTHQRRLLGARVAGEGRRGEGRPRGSSHSRSRGVRRRGRRGAFGEQVLECVVASHHGGQVNGRATLDVETNEDENAIVSENLDELRSPGNKCPSVRANRAATDCARA
jgi:hypothetical protein